MIDAFLDKGLRPDVFSIVNGAYDGFHAFLGDLLRFVQIVCNADDSNYAGRTQIRAVFFLSTDE
ncbi:MAG: hypothetical protein ACYDGO_11720 [Smithellaceae bacterium]